MKGKKELKGFTLVETLVGISLFVLIVSFVYFAFHNFNRYSSFFFMDRKHVLEMASLDQTFNREFFLAEKAEVEGDKVILSLKGHSIAYQLLDSMMIRTSAGISDTFRIRA